MSDPRASDNTTNRMLRSAADSVHRVEAPPAIRPDLTHRASRDESTDSNQDQCRRQQDVLTGTGVNPWSDE